MQQSPQPNQLLWQRFKRSFCTVKHVRKCLPELESPTYIAWSCTTGGGDGDKTKHKGVTGGCCLHYITFSYPVGIFLLGWYKQQARYKQAVQGAVSHQVGLNASTSIGQVRSICVPSLACQPPALREAHPGP